MSDRKLYMYELSILTVNIGIGEVIRFSIGWWCRHHEG